MSKYKDQIARIEAILGPDNGEDFQAATTLFLKHLKSHLQLPCQVKGIEDFNWEEPYIFGGWSVEEYKELKETQPSYEDRFQLLAIKRREYSEWMLCPEDDLAAHVKRISDGRKFVLGLSELEATDRKSPNRQLLHDYSVFFCNYR